VGQLVEVLWSRWGGRRWLPSCWG